MSVLGYVFGVLFIIVCVALVVLVLAQEGKNQGLGAIQGTVENTYWSKNKGRSREGMMLMLTRVFSAVGLLLVILLNMSRLH